MALRNVFVLLGFVSNIAAVTVAEAKPVDERAFKGDYENYSHVQDALNLISVGILTNVLTDYAKEKKEIILLGLTSAKGSHLPLQEVLAKTSFDSEESNLLELKTLDLCCGQGKQTAALNKNLHTIGINNKAFGCDISPEQIARAKEVYSKEQEVQFFVADVDNLITSENNFDCVYSFFGLHWANNIQKVAQDISNLLKPAGKVFFVVPTEDDEFFFHRRKFLKEGDYAAVFAKENFDIKQLISDYKVYELAFNDYFVMDDIYTVAKKANKSYNRQDFINFLCSWMPEVRFLKDKGMDYKDYVGKMIDSFPNLASGILKKSASGDISTDFTLFYYLGTKGF